MIEIYTSSALASPLPRHPSFLCSSYAGTLDDEFAVGTMSPSAFLRSIPLREAVRRARMDQGSASKLGAGVR